MLGLFHRYPSLFRPLLTSAGKLKLNAKQVAAAFEVKWSPVGSNAREEEEAVVMGWREYLFGVEGSYSADTLV